ncbi:hypothetical protein [Hellea balneolensis]|uniref:hypothetical protein n=1 Tax=Hellea balneolensis TaxID=287478 RepID=UPI000423B4EB|nr:hypothetical protein [Hellea balneolensis]
MGLRLTIALTACLSMTACATVDLNEVALQSKPSASKAVDINVVQRATAKLYAAFTSRGFVDKDSRNKMRSAARVLLEGLEEKDVTSEASVGYAALASDSRIVLSDIRIASTHVEQTTKAAEVYLAMAPAEKKLRKELVSLEKSLIASREAATIFEEALIKTTGRASDTEFVSFKVSVNELRDVTNAFGDRVRESQMHKANRIN